MNNILIAIMMVIASVANAGWFGDSKPKGEVCLYHPLEPKLISCTPVENLENFFKKAKSDNEVVWEKDDKNWILRINNFDKVTKTKDSLSFVFTPAYGKYGVSRLAGAGLDTANVGVIHSAFSQAFDQARQGK